MLMVTCLYAAADFSEAIEAVNAFKVRVLFSVLGCRKPTKALTNSKTGSFYGLVFYLPHD